MSNSSPSPEFFAQLGRLFSGEEIFDHIEDTVFFIKSRDSRYVAVNNTLVQRCGFERKEDLLGKTAREVFPPPLGDRFLEQDRQILSEGSSIHAQLELHLYSSGAQGWCLTWKQPIRDSEGRIAGLSGISRDLGLGNEVQRDLPALSKVLEHVREHLDQPLPLAELAELAGLSTYQLDQRIRSLFGVSAGQYVTRTRIETACHLLQSTSSPISQIALDCGYNDQSAFTRQFRLSTGLPPNAYRKQTSRSQS